MPSDDAEIHMDPIVDGRPRPSALLIGIAVLALGAGAVEIASGQFSLGLAHAVVGMAAWVADRNRRRGWDRGYHAAIDSVERSIEYVEGGRNGGE